MRLGLDVVDLAAAKGEHPRFASRILSAAEALRLPQGEPSDLWAYWAAKEAAYKAFVQKPGVSRQFSPPLWEVSEDWTRVGFAGEEFQLRMKRGVGEDLILAEATDGDWESVVSAEAVFWREPSPDEQKAEARRLLTRLAEVHLPPLERQLVKEEGIPRLRAGSAIWPLCLSHHGRFVAANLSLHSIASPA